MAKKIAWASVRVPDYPRVRFFKKKDGTPPLVDVTEGVVRLEIEQLDKNGSSPIGEPPCKLTRLDAHGQIVWSTTHASLQETRWHCEFEFGLPEEKWNAY